MAMTAYSYLKDSSSATPLVDSDLGLVFVKDHEDIGNPNLLRECSIKFLKLLFRCDFVRRLPNSNDLVFRPFRRFEEIDRIVACIRQDYINRYLHPEESEHYFFDYDMNDEIFDHFEIVSPDKLYDEHWRLRFIEQHGHKFSRSTRRNQLIGVQTFLNDRAKLFCFYVFLRRCAILFRDTSYSVPYLSLVDLLATPHDPETTSSQAKTYLRVKNIKYAGDNWSTGLHEWLTCEKTIQALRRTAGEISHVAPRLEPVEGLAIFPGEAPQPFTFSEVNWIDLQFLIRTSTKFVIFVHNLNGHPGAVSETFNNGKSGALIDGSDEFHATINSLFEKSTHIGDFMLKIFDLYHEQILNDLNTPIVDFHGNMAGYFADGTPTHDYGRIQFFQRIKLREPREDMHIWLRDILNQIDISRLQEGQTISYRFIPDRILPVAYAVHQSPEISI